MTIRSSTTPCVTDLCVFYNLQLVIQAYDSLVPDQIAEATLVISVDNSAPVINPRTDNIDVSEFQALGTLYRVNATDVDGDQLTFTLQNPNAVVNNFFWLNPSDGAVMLQRSLTTVSTDSFQVSFY